MTPGSACTTVDVHALRRPRSCAHRMVMGGLLFALLGPPIGAIVVACAMAGVAVWEESAPLVEAPGSLPLLFLMMLFSYPMGAVPALVTGIAVGSLSPRLTGWRIASAGGLVGGLTSAFFTWALFWQSFGTAQLGFGAIGILPGAVLAYAFFRRDTARHDREPAHDSSPHPAPQ